MQELADIRLQCRCAFLEIKKTLQGNNQNITAVIILQFTKNAGHPVKTTQDMPSLDHVNGSRCCTPL